jgi:hypothetical protein
MIPLKSPARSEKPYALKAVLQVEGSPKFAECGFATLGEAEAVAGWDAKFAGTEISHAKDAAEFAALANKRWRYYRQQGASVDSVTELRRAIDKNQFAEVSMMAVARAQWFADGGILGVCHFRRTWFNNLFIDFLTTQPEIAARSGQKISGVGTWLLSFVVGIANHIEAPAVWGEATKDSAEFYRKTFSLRRATDEFRFVRRHYAGFLERTQAKALQDLENFIAARPKPNIVTPR